MQLNSDCIDKPLQIFSGVIPFCIKRHAFTTNQAEQIRIRKSDTKNSSADTGAVRDKMTIAINTINVGLAVKTVAKKRWASLKPSLLKWREPRLKNGNDLRATTVVVTRVINAQLLAVRRHQCRHRCRPRCIVNRDILTILSALKVHKQHNCTMRHPRCTTRLTRAHRKGILVVLMLQTSLTTEPSSVSQWMAPTPTTITIATALIAM